IKGIEFGIGFKAAVMKGSEHNDPWIVKNGKIQTSKNDSGGIIGGISTGMPIEFSIAVKPTASIGILQKTVNIKTMENIEIKFSGRHDPCIVPRIIPVVEAMVAVVLLDYLINIISIISIYQLMDIEIYPLTNNLMGEITAPGSKSYSHRAFIAASLAEGISVINNPITTGDAAITMKNLRNLGVKIIKSSDNSYIVKRDQGSFKKNKLSLDCGNSGTTIRVFSALSLLVKGGLLLTGDFLKLKRPIIPLLNALKILGAKYDLSDDKLKIKRIKTLCNKVKIPGNITSQFLTALLIVGDQDDFRGELQLDL
ncbi:unnamed protein product, partial [marine sediment metagenome]